MEIDSFNILGYKSVDNMSISVAKRLELFCYCFLFVCLLVFVDVYRRFGQLSMLFALKISLKYITEYTSCIWTRTSQLVVGGNLADQITNYDQMKHLSPYQDFINIKVP